MLLYQHAVMTLIEEYRKAAVRFRDRFDARAPAQELLADIRLLTAAYERLAEAYPGVRNCEGPARHLYWCSYYLEKGDAQGCGFDPESLCTSDIEKIETSFRDWSTSGEQIDPELYLRIAPPLKRCELDSALRRAFIVLKERMVSVSGLGAGLDGPALVNKLFAAKGVFQEGLGSERCQALRNFLSGIYSLFRNPHAHNDVQTSFVEADAALSAINWAMFELEELRVSRLPGTSVESAEVLSEGWAEE